ncbi:hypothetical protein BO993_03890 [Xanthomonas oryzae pv. oryzae]|nr:hypothetical protein BO993_03890 [Xanthomonas oryzae pv. oryzae]
MLKLLLNILEPYACAFAFPYKRSNLQLLFRQLLPQFRFLGTPVGIVDLFFLLQLPRIGGGTDPFTLSGLKISDVSIKDTCRVLPFALSIGSAHSKVTQSNREPTKHLNYILFMLRLKRRIFG